MLPIVLVLLVVSNALAAPSVGVSLVAINEVAPRQGGGSALVDRALEVQDNGEKSVYVQLLQELYKDLANLSDAKSESIALTQVIGTLGRLATGVPGDACAEASVIDASVLGNGVAGARANYIRNLIGDIYNIAKISRNNDALKFAVGSRGNCNGAGRTFAFEQAWDLILSSSSPIQRNVLNDQYCASKRLYTGQSSISNNVAAAATAAALPSVSDVLVQAVNELRGFVAAINTANAIPAANRLEQRLARLANL